MRKNVARALLTMLVALSWRSTVAQTPESPDPIRALVTQLDLQTYKTTIKALTQFGDRREGTDRNRAAIDWIEAQFKSYGCADIERLRYEYRPAPLPSPAPAAARPPAVPARAAGGGRMRGPNAFIPPETDANAQPDVKLRALNMQPTKPGTREDIFCTKVGKVHPNEMYIVSAHMDGRGFGEAANDDASGTALVMELARIFSNPDVATDRSIRFILWNNEETGLQGSSAYVSARRDLQGKESPAGSGRYPEPTWLGVAQHDMMMFDHGMPRTDGTVSAEQRPEADVNIEFQESSQFAGQSQALAWAFQGANEKYATDYPAVVGRHMTNTDSASFQDTVASISLRENERGAQIGAGWDPQWHRATDLFATYSDKDFRLGLNAAQTTLAGVGQLAGAALKK